MRSWFRRTRGLFAAGVIGMLMFGAPYVAGRALAADPNNPYIDSSQDADAAPTAWLLMAPPTTNSGVTVDSQAGLANWITYGRYNTLQDCSETIQIVRNGAIPVAGMPPQASNGAISVNTVPIPNAMRMPPTAYSGAPSGYGAPPAGMPPGYSPAQPGYPPQAYLPQGYAPQGYAMGQPGYAGAPPPSGYAGSQPGGYPGMQPGYLGAPSGQTAMPSAPSMQPGYGTSPGYRNPPGYGTPGYGTPGYGTQPAYGMNPPPQMMIQQPAQYMTRQQADAAYCFADNDRRIQGLVTPPPPATTPGAQQLNDLTNGAGQGFPSGGP